MGDEGTSSVTWLREHPRKAGRYPVELDGVALGAVSLETVALLGLRVGRVLDSDSRAKLDAAVRATACYDKALGALARRGRSRVELGRWLKQREFSAAEIEPALDRLESLGLLNDLEFARAFARSRMQGRGFGARRVAAELARRGVSRAVVSEVLGQVTAEDGVDELTTAVSLVARRAKSLSALEPSVAKRRLYGYLTRRGFGADVIRVTLAKYAAD